MAPECGAARRKSSPERGGPPLRALVEPARDC